MWLCIVLSLINGAMAFSNYSVGNFAAAMFNIFAAGFCVAMAFVNFVEGYR